MRCLLPALLLPVRPTGQGPRNLRPPLKDALSVKASSLCLPHLQDNFDPLDTVSQLAIPGYLPPHPFYTTADRTEMGNIEFPADLLQIVTPQ